MKLFCFKKKNETIALSFSDYKGCPCYISHHTITLKKHVKAILFNSFEEMDSEKVLRHKNVMVLAHGNPIDLKCFLKKESITGIKEIYVNNDYWHSLFAVRGVFYFHVCFGSKIIDKISSTNDVWKNWVSYENEINWFYHDDVIINNIYENFNSNLCELINKTKSSFAFYNSLKASYFSLISQITDRNTGKPIVGYEYMITLMLRNVESLNHSK